MSTLTQTKTDPSAIPTPATGQTSNVVDLAGVLRQKQDDGSVTPASPNVATSIEPSSPSTPIPITGGAGTVGDVLAKTTDSGAGEVGLVEPRVQGISQNVRQLRAVVTAGAQTNDLVLGELLVVDLEAIAGPHEVLLPAAPTADSNRSVCIKIFGDAAGQTLTITPDGADFLDKDQTTRAITNTREFITYRVRVGGGGWLEVSE
ncbi:MAG: hypothetical protein O7G84_01300 [Gammaproteobacteria bacterium]|nr:hypothetical protein [Gammaproteobacteria bacterium]